MTGSGRAPRPSARARRSAARLAAVQALYQIMMRGGDADADAVIGEFVAHRVGADLDGDRFVEPERSLFTAIVRGASTGAGALDTAISGALAGGWTLQRMEPLLRAILRAGAWELAEHRELPVAIIIDEYLELAHAFFAGGEPAMVNAVLDRLAQRRGVDPAIAADG